MPQAASWSGTPSIRGSTESVRMALLTASLVGLQFTWGIEMTYGTPYLLSLGLTKAHTSAVWIAGPLSGLIMQPLVGVLADDSKSRWGRRRPFMVAGSFVVFGCLLVLGWTVEIVGKFTADEEKRKSWTIALAIASIYATDFSINVVQSCCRSLIVDTLPIPKQQLGSAWATRMGAVGHLICYGIGTIDLHALWGNFLGDTQFKQLCVIAGLALIFAQSLTSYCVEERILISSADANKSKSTFSVLAKIFSMTRHLPPRIQAICWVQFWSWIGWFPFLFYSPTWVGETYFRFAPPSSIPPSTDKLGELGRIGSMSLVIFSTITFFASILLPFLIRSPDRSASTPFTPRPPPFIAPLLKTLKPLTKHKPDLLSAWLVSHFVFAIAMLLTPFVQSLHAATVLVSISGLPWTIAGWAPFAFMGMEINRLTLNANAGSSANGSTSNGHLRAHSYSVSEEEPTMLRLKHQGEISDDEDDALEEGSLLGGGGAKEGFASTGETAGIYLGILNLFTTLPQFVGTFISMIVFAIFEAGGEGKKVEGGKDVAGKEPEKVEGVNPIAVCLFIGGVCSLVAAYATRRLKKVK